VNLTSADVLQAIVAGLAATLGVHATQAALAALRRAGRCPDCWTGSRTFLLLHRRRGSEN
jgi:hypothetical protein